MSKEKKNIIHLLILVVILILVIILAIKVFNKKEDIKVDESEEKLKSVGINTDDEEYKDMKVYEENGDLIVESNDGSKTVVTTKTKEDTGMKETTEDIREKYELTDVQVNTTASNTIVIGKIKNNTNEKHKTIINIKFYSNDKKIVGATSTKVEVDANSVKDFRAGLMEDMSSYTYQIMVEYTD